MSDTRTHKISRPRPSFSCVVCRRRKVRCEREQPSCSNCIKVNEKCQYEDNPRTRQLRSEPTAAPSAQKPEISRPMPTPEPTTSQTTAASEYPWASAGNNPQGEPNDQRQNWKTSMNTDDTYQNTRAGDNAFSAGLQHSGTTNQRHTTSQPSYRNSSTSSTAFPSRQGSQTPQQGSANKGSNELIRPNSPATLSNILSRRAAISRKRPRSPAGSSDQSRQMQNEAETHEGSNVSEPTQTQGYLSAIGGGEIRYVGSAFWGYARGHELLCELLLMEDGNSKNTNTPQPHIDSLGLASLLKTLPAKPVCDVFLYSFLIGVRPILPLIHVPSFLSDYNDYWEWYATVSTSNITLPTAKLLDDPTFLCLFFSVIYCGAVTASSSIWNADVLRDIDKVTIINHCRTLHSTCQILCQGLRHPTCNTLVASLLAHECSTQERDCFTDGEFVSTVIRISRSMGMHRDGSVLGLDPIASELRRRIWWHIVWIDLRISVRTGSPTLCSIHPSQQDVQMINHARDEGLEKEDKFEVLPNKQPPSPKSIALIFTEAHYETARFEHNLVSHLNGTQGMGQAQVDDLLKSMKKLHEKIDVLIDKIPAQGIPEKGLITSRITNAIPLLHEKLYSDNSSEPTVFMSWARIMLTMLKSGTLLLLQTALLGRVDVGEKETERISLSIVQISISYLRHYLLLIQVPSFEPYAWCLLNRQTSLKCVFLILTYLRNHQNSPQSDLARYFADEVLEHFAAEDVSKESEGSGSSRKISLIPDTQTSAAWKKLRAIRNKIGTPHTLDHQGSKVCVPSESCFELARMLFAPPETDTDVDLEDSLPAHSLSSSNTASTAPTSRYLSQSLPGSSDGYKEHRGNDNMIDISELLAWSDALNDEPNSFYTGPEPMYSLTSPTSGAETMYPLTSPISGTAEKFDSFNNWMQLSAFPMEIGSRINGTRTAMENTNLGPPVEISHGRNRAGEPITTELPSSRQAVAEERLVSNLLNSMMDG